MNRVAIKHQAGGTLSRSGYRCSEGVGGFICPARQPNVVTWTPFVDQLWDAERGAERARLDAIIVDPLSGTFPPGDTPAKRHVAQSICLGDSEINDHQLLDKAFSLEGSALAILADAGLGKSELLQWLEWRYAVTYESAVAQRGRLLPSIMLRVPLLGLRSMSMDSISNFLAQPDTANNLPALRGIESGAFLTELLRMKRIVLLLDGVDELITTRERLESEIRDIRRITADGGRIALTARLGHFRSVGLITRVFRPREIARINPMSPESGQQVLVKHGASQTTAAEIVRAITPSPAAGIPLFLLMAYRAGVTSSFTPENLSSRTSLLLELVHLFCIRDEPRLDLDTEEQQRYLTELAQWMNVDGDLDVAECLERLGLEASDPASALITNPHALLTRDENGIIKYKYPHFYPLFLSKAISSEWRDFGWRAVKSELEAKRLDDHLCEYLAHMLTGDLIRTAWGESSSLNRSRALPLLRRNLLALALSQVDEQLNGSSPTARGNLLHEILGVARLEDVSLTEVTVSRLDFSGWTLKSIHGAGGSLMYCIGLPSCNFDKTIWTVDRIEGCDFPDFVDGDAVLAAGFERLRQMLVPRRQKNATALLSKVSVRECRDVEGWKGLAKLGYVKRERLYGGGTPFWVFVDSAAITLAKHISKPPEDVVKENVGGLGANIYQLLMELGRVQSK